MILVWHFDRPTEMSYIEPCYGTNTSYISSIIPDKYYFHKVDKIDSVSSYKILKLWEIHNFIFTKSP